MKKIKHYAGVAIICISVCMAIQFPITYALKKCNVEWAQKYWNNLRSEKRWIQLHL